MQTAERRDTPILGYAHAGGVDAVKRPWLLGTILRRSGWHLLAAIAIEAT